MFLPSGVSKTEKVIYLIILIIIKIRFEPTWGAYSQKYWAGVFGQLPKTLTLFMTEICDFPYPIYDQKSANFMTYL